MQASQTTTSLFWKFCLLGPCEGSGQDVWDAVAREAAPPAADETGICRLQVLLLRGMPRRNLRERG